MGLFDMIDRIKTAATEHELPEKLPGSSPTEAKPEALADRITTAEATNPGHKPEKLAFLHPCPACSCRLFVYKPGGEFICTNCHPEARGQLAEATGPALPPPSSNSPSPEQEAKKEKAKTKRKRSSTRLFPCGGNPANFAASWPWLNENLPALGVAGWTRRALFQRGKLKYPAGSWGVAWLDAWLKRDLAAQIGRGGRIEFSFRSGERLVQQTATPPPASQVKPAR